MDIEKAMQFMLEHQARHDAAIQQLDETVKGLVETSKKHDEQIATVADLVGRLAQAEIRTLERMNELAAAQKHTDERLDAFIVTVERYIEDRGNGHKRE